MALKKICPHCNKNLIDYKDKHCPACTDRVKKEKKASWQHYDKTVRKSEDNLKFYEFYQSDEWEICRSKIKSKYFGLCVYDYLVNKIITFGDAVHHVEPIKVKWDLRLTESNLLLLSSSNHNFIHDLYNKDYEGARELLYRLMNAWDKLFYKSNFTPRGYSGIFTEMTGNR